jgi:hypothetical protein
MPMVDTSVGDAGVDVGVGVDQRHQREGVEVPAGDAGRQPQDVLQERRLGGAVAVVEQHRNVARPPVDDEEVGLAVGVDDLVRRLAVGDTARSATRRSDWR